MKGWETRLDHFCVNCARSYVGRKVSLHMKDGSVIINVLFKSVTDRKAQIIGRHGKVETVPLNTVLWAERINSFEKGGGELEEET